MAPYTICHLKLEMLLKEKGFIPKDKERPQRFNVFLNNTLDEVNPHLGTLFASWLSHEATEANYIKKETPLMVIIGNPPYSGESFNKGAWMMELMEDYKKEPGGLVRLKEKNPKWINDDYVKFLRYGQFLIERNGEGILAFINNNGYLDNPTFRGMRWNLLNVYENIYIINLHGNAKKRETCADGSIDSNVFDIMQGVSINIFVKTQNKKPNSLAKVYISDLYGTRDLKYDFLWDNNIETVKTELLENKAPYYFFVKKDFKSQEEYEEGFSMTELFKVNSVGIVTARDKFTIHNSSESVMNTFKEFLKLEKEEARDKFNLGEDAKDWTIANAKEDLLNSGLEYNKIAKILYRPFDEKYTYFTGNPKGIHCRPRKEVMSHFYKHENIGLCLCKQFKTGNEYKHVFISNRMIESSYVSNRTSEITSIFPLYLYPQKTNQKEFISENKKTNLNNKIIDKISQKIGLIFSEENTKKRNNYSPIDVFDYVYAILFSPNYRNKYKEFLKYDFPKIPYPQNKDIFLKLVKLGTTLREIHLLKHPVLNKYITQYKIEGDNYVAKIKYCDEKVFINKNQYFYGVPKKAWESWIGGYQPAQKWLKDRKNTELNYDEIIHYQKIIVALVETNKIIKEIEQLI